MLVAQAKRLRRVVVYVPYRCVTVHDCWQACSSRNKSQNKNKNKNKKGSNNTRRTLWLGHRASRGSRHSHSDPPNMEATTTPTKQRPIANQILNKTDNRPSTQTHRDVSHGQTTTSSVIIGTNVQALFIGCRVGACKAGDYPWNRQQHQWRHCNTTQHRQRQQAVTHERQSECVGALSGLHSACHMYC